MGGAACILRLEDFRFTVYRTTDGDIGEYTHLRVGIRVQFRLADQHRGRFEFVWKTMQAITLDLDLAARASPEAAELVASARRLDSDGLTRWASGSNSDAIWIAIFETLRRGEPLPEAALYANQFAMGNQAIRTYLLTAP